MTGRWSAVESARHGKAMAPLTPEQRQFWSAMLRLSQSEDFQALLDYSRDRIEQMSVDPTAPDTGALLLIEGQRTLCRTFRSLRATAEAKLKATDERSGGQG